MKIRIKGNSVRLRLSRSEVDYFGQNGYIEEKTEFGGSDLTYALQSNDIEHVLADFKNNTITMYVPDSFRAEWTTTERIGIEGTADIGNGKSLHLLLEKDFKCLDQAAEDQSDNYDNPLITGN